MWEPNSSGEPAISREPHMCENELWTQSLSESTVYIGTGWPICNEPFQNWWQGVKTDVRYISYSARNKEKSVLFCTTRSRHSFPSHVSVFLTRYKRRQIRHRRFHSRWERVPSLNARRQLVVGSCVFVFWLIMCWYLVVQTIRWVQLDK